MWRCDGHTLTVREQVFCNRDCILKTFTERGLDYIGQMALQNCRDLEPILWWNYEHGVRLFRRASHHWPGVCRHVSAHPARGKCPGVALPHTRKLSPSAARNLERTPPHICGA